MKKVAVPMFVVLGLLAGVPMAQASDASLRHALKNYETRLTTDIGYLSSFSAPRRARASAALHTIATVRGDLSGATAAGNSQQASSNSGRRGRALVLTGLSEASLAASDARASAVAARAGQRAVARHDAQVEHGEIMRAVTSFEAGGRLLHLF